MEVQTIRFPFMTPRRPSDVEEGYFKMMQTRFIPNFELVSLSSFIIIANILIFIVIHILYSPTSYASFLEWPREMDPWLLEVEKVKSNRLYIYQAVTAMFMHASYLHLAGNTIFSLFVMHEMEYSWKLSIPLGLVAGFCANCLAIVLLEGRFLGFSGVLTSYVGMIVALYLCHCSYFQARSRGAFCMMAVMLIFLSVMVIGFGKSVLIHLFGYLFGMLLSVGFYPKHA